MTTSDLAGWLELPPPEQRSAIITVNDKRYPMPTATMSSRSGSFLPLASRQRRTDGALGVPSVFVAAGTGVLVTTEFGTLDCGLGKGTRHEDRQAPAGTYQPAAPLGGASVDSDRGPAPAGVR